MTLELRPMGVACNLACRYCYQNPQREAGNQRRPYSLEKIKAEAERNVSMIMRQALVQFKLGSSGSLWGGLIHTAVGLAGGTGGFLTKRSGLVSKA
jgi:hypothetical protein